MTIVLAHPSQSTLLTRRAGPAAAKRPSPPCWLAWQRDPAREVENLRTFYHRERSRAETIRQTVATRRRHARRPQSPRPPNEQAQVQVQPQPQPQPQPEPLPQPTNPTPSPTSERSQMLLGMYASLLDSRLQSVERVSKLLSDWQDHKPLPPTAFPSSAFP